MKRLILFLLASLALTAQTLVPTAPSTIQAGKAFDLSVDLTAPATPVTGVQYNLGFSPATAITSPLVWTASPATTAAGKSLVCGGPASTQTCIVFGFNITPLASGSVAKAHITVPADVRGPVVFTTSGTLASDKDGNNVAVTGGTVTVLVTSPFDLNGDGSVNSSDLSSVLSQVVGLTPCTTADFNGDGKCTVHDAALLVKDGLNLP